MSNPAFEAAHATVCALIDRFENGILTYRGADYKEAEAREDFLSPLFIALDWDVRHESQLDPLAQEVKIEKNVHMAEGRKSADYSFALAPQFNKIRFYCEVKKPAVKLPNPDACFQTVRYGWNGGTPVSLLSDFESTFVMDCRAKPELESATARVLQKWTLADWRDRDKFAEFYARFGREGVEGGSLERYVEALKAPVKGSSKQRKLFGTAAAPVDTVFLDQLEAWRCDLAVAFLRARPSLSAEALTESTQRALDRLVFLRFLEDKLIETRDRVSTWHGGDAWREFRVAARELDRDYNGVLWKKHPVLDDPDFNPAGVEWERVCWDISNNQTAYLFNLIPIPILGSIYERFLGNVIEVSTDSKVKVVLKPENRKAGGVYYTPESIVEYIVSRTVERLILDKAPRDVEKMRFADIACGSGSFLLGVYDALLRWHTAYYNANPKSARKGDVIDTGSGLRLSLSKRRAILENNIWGSDIDAQAVEVSKLSLYLKLLEDETANSARQFQLDFAEKILPNLEKNIVCGNALVSWDILETQTLSDEEEAHINPMDWQATFSEILRNGGFDAIVGNPPYGAELSPMEREYLDDRWKIGTTDTAALMMVQAGALLKKNAINGFIIPKPFVYASNWEKTRELLLPSIVQMVDVGKVWAKVKLEQVIYISRNETKSNIYSVGVRRDQTIVDLGKTDKEYCEEFGFILNGVSNAEIALAFKIKSVGKSLSDFISNTRGGMFQKQIVSEPVGKRAIGGANIQNEGFKSEKGFVKDVSTLPRQCFVKPESILVQNIVAHIANPFDHIKITAFVAGDSASEIVILDTVNQLVNTSTLPSAFIRALITSKLINWFVYRFIYAKAIRTMHFDSPVSNRIPVPDEADSEEGLEKARQIEKLDIQRIAAQTDLAKAATERETNRAQNKISSLDNRIDQLVYELYRLTDDEIAIVEAAYSA